MAWRRQPHNSRGYTDIQRHPLARRRTEAGAEIRGLRSTPEENDWEYARKLHEVAADMHRNRGGDGLRKIRTGMERNRGHITIQSPTEGEEESGKAEPLAPEQARSVLANTQLAIRGEYEAQPTVTQAGKLTDAVIDYYGERAYNVHHIVGMTAEKMRPIVEKYLEANNGARALLEYSGVNSLSELRLGGIRKEPTVRVLRSMNHLVGLLLSAHFIASAHNASGFR